MATSSCGRADTRLARARRRRRATIGALAVAIAAVCLAVLAFGGSGTDGARVIRYTINSPLVHARLPQTAVIPPVGPSSGRALLVFLHGKGEGAESNLVSGLYAELRKLGSRAPDVVFPYGGEDSYWHDRSDGAWGEYVIREVIPDALTRLHADPARVAIGGLSMGGFGSYDLALSHPGRFCAVGGDSAALWRSGAESAAGAFDSAEDFERNNVIGAARSGGGAYRGVALWLDVGSEDPFRSADTELAQLLRSDGLAIRFRVWPGRHEPAYWDSHWNSYLAFYAAALAHCHRP